MAPLTDNSGTPTDLLGRLPAEIKLQILGQLNGRDFYSMIQVDRGCSDLWLRYPQQIFREVWHNNNRALHPQAQSEAFIAFQLRQARQAHIEATSDGVDPRVDRNRLQMKLSTILLDDNDDDEEMDIKSLVAHSDLISEVNSLVDRYANDSWNRIRGIALETGTGSSSPTGTGQIPPKISLTAAERGRFQLAFVAAEIYLLSTFYTNGQGQRQRLSTNPAIYDYVPYSPAPELRRQRRRFDSCLRYIFHAYRVHLRSTARELGVSEFPVEEDQLVADSSDEAEEPPRKRLLTSEPSAPLAHATRQGGADDRFDDTTKAFAHRSIQEEQAFLLWLCESGIGPLEKTHRAPDAERRTETLRQFGRKDVWGSTMLRHWRSTDTCLTRNARTRHPIKNLYGFFSRIRSGTIGVPWACASAFLDWEFVEPNGGSKLRRRGDVVLNERGRWITMSDTDNGACDWNPFESQRQVVPDDHPYRLDRNEYTFRPLPRKIFLMEP